MSCSESIVNLSSGLRRVGHFQNIPTFYHTGKERPLPIGRGAGSTSMARDMVKAEGNIPASLPTTDILLSIPHPVMLLIELSRFNMRRHA